MSDDDMRMNTPEKWGDLEIDPNGAMFDPETGEYFGTVPGGIDTDAAITREVAERFMDERVRLDCELIALDAEEGAVRRNIEARRRRVKRRIEFWDDTRKQALVAWAQGQLYGRGRTVHLNHGKILVRKTRAKYTITNPDLAVEFVRRHAPDEVIVTERVDVGGVKAAFEAAGFDLEDIENDQNAEGSFMRFLDIRPSQDKWSIDTGVKPEDNTEGGDL